MSPDTASEDAFRFDGRTVPFRPGQTVGGALAASGVVSWRTTRGGGEPRGLFCGIGVCYDCLLSVDGLRSQRACVTRARPGQDVRSDDPDAPLPAPTARSAPRPAPEGTDS
ncbi:(2Fe-2S)-binding protein [Microbacterium sp. cf332]|uniref:(2Fe-2S)-binding protein n=1 Tax=Microbacterium sp. cf332 TaxID=1761804 RepID=UPI000890CE5C|nr:(2Fe-2S)-binding protein [Microbacterium sp. cf332]SDQ49251.1 2Fe-2S iron-sulfur cluster binding domain-containing protein [Microbacterium sp. cf332]